jgi:hypothetical protein
MKTVQASDSATKKRFGGDSVQLPMTLRPSRKKTALLFLLCLGFVLGGVWMVRSGETEGYFVAGFFGLGLPVFALQFHPRAAYLELRGDGFTFCGLFRAHTVRWTEVQEFGVMDVEGNAMVGWNFRPECPTSRRARSVSKFISGYEGALPDTYGMKAQALCELMESLRQRCAVIG